MRTQHQQEKAYKELKYRLKAQSIAPGTRLTEQYWSKLLGVNRGDIRLALARLFTEGYLEKGQRGGYFARRYDEDYIHAGIEARLILEIGAVRLSIARATEEDIRLLESIYSHMCLMAENGYIMGFSEADVRFHEVLIQAAHNPVLSQIYEMANIPKTAFAEIPQAQVREDLLRDADHHARMLEALKAKDVAQLEYWLRKGPYSKPVDKVKGGRDAHRL